MKSFKFIMFMPIVILLIRCSGPLDKKYNDIDFLTTINEFQHKDLITENEKFRLKQYVKLDYNISYRLYDKSYNDILKDSDLALIAISSYTEQGEYLTAKRLLESSKNLFSKEDWEYYVESVLLEEDILNFVSITKDKPQLTTDSRDAGDLLQRMLASSKNSWSIGTEQEGYLSNSSNTLTISIIVSVIFTIETSVRASMFGFSKTNRSTEYEVKETVVSNLKPGESRSFNVLGSTEQGNIQNSGGSISIRTISKIKDVKVELYKITPLFNIHSSKTDEEIKFDRLFTKYDEKGMMIYCNRYGESVIKQQFQKAYYFNEDEVAIVKQNGQYGIIDKKGDFIINPRFEDALGFSEGLAAAKQNGKWGYINKEGNWVIKPQFDRVYIFNEGLAEAEQNGKWGFIDKIGNFVIKPRFEQTWAFSEGLAVAKQDGKWGFSHKIGNFVIKPRFEYSWGFSESLAATRQNGKWGYINKEGDWIIKPQFGRVYNFNEGLAAVIQNGKYGYINKEGNWVIKPQFEDASGFTNSCAVVKQDGKWGCISKQGDWIVKPQFNNKKSLFYFYASLEKKRSLFVGN